MKCTKCGGVAVMNMPQHRLKLCAEHYVEWIPSMVQRAIAKYGMFQPDDRILVAVSGGKDSLTLWDVLVHLGYRTEGVYINLGIDHHAYSDVSQEHAEAFASASGDLVLHVVNVQETYGSTVPDLQRTGRGRRMCSACGLVKRHIMNRIAYEGDYAAIATGHNLDDEVAVLMGNTLHWQSGYLRRQAPVLPQTHPKLARKVKPLCHLYERESAGYALVRGISFVEQECPFAVGAKSIFYKGILNRLERSSRGTKMQFYLSFLQAKRDGLMTPSEPMSEIGECEECGQPTTAGGICAFCRLWRAAASGD